MPHGRTFTAKSNGIMGRGTWSDQLDLDLDVDRLTTWTLS